MSFIHRVEICIRYHGRQLMIFCRDFTITCYFGVNRFFLLFYCRCHVLYLQSVTVNTAFFFTLSPALNMIFACQLRLVCCVYCSWTSANRDMLEEQDSCLEFKLHRLQFIEMVANSPQDSAEVLRFAKHFARFSKRHTRGKHHMKFALYMIFIFLMKAFFGIVSSRWNIQVYIWHCSLSVLTAFVRK